MTTDTAVRVTRMVILDQSKTSTSHTEESSLNDNQAPLDHIPYVDFPELKLDEHESTEMPFRYVKGPDCNPVMPEVP